MLPWACGPRMPQHDGRLGQDRTNDIGNQTILRKIAATKHVAAASRRHRDAARLEVAVAKCTGEDVRRRLRCGVRFVAAEAIGLPESLSLLIVPVHLI